MKLKIFAISCLKTRVFNVIITELKHWIDGLKGDSLDAILFQMSIVGIRWFFCQLCSHVGLTLQFKVKFIKICGPVSLSIHSTFTITYRLRIQEFEPIKKKLKTYTRVKLYFWESNQGDKIAICYFSDTTCSGHVLVHYFRMESN